MSPSTSLEQEAAPLINYYKQNFTNFKLPDSVSSTLGNASVTKSISPYDNVENGTDQKDLEFLTIKGDNVYHIIYSAETRAFDRWLKTAKHMIESLELSSSGSINGSYDTRVFSDWLTTELPVPMSVNPLTNMIYTVNDFSDGIDVNTFENAEIQA